MNLNIKAEDIHIIRYGELEKILNVLGYRSGPWYFYNDPSKGVLYCSKKDIQLTLQEIRKMTGEED